eukprot:jgi/Mesen1/10467/ME000082S09971
MVKTYLRYEAAAAFGVVVSSGSNIVYDASGRLLLAPALEDCLLWNIKQGTAVKTLSAPASSSSSGAQGAKPEVTAIARPYVESSQVAVGYASGAVRLWDVGKEGGACDVALTGHRGAVTALRYNRASGLLASGGKDTDVVVWDTVAEAGLFRLRGHRDQVTDVVFVERVRCLVSASKDTLVRVWDLDTQHCVQTLVAHRCEVWSLDVDPAQRLLVTGAADAHMRAFSISAPDADGRGGGSVLAPLGSVARQSAEKALTVRFNASGTLLGCQSAGKVVELYRGEETAAKKAKRRLKRKREREQQQPLQSHAEQEGDTAVAENLTTAADELALLHVVRTKHKIRSFAFSPRKGGGGVEATLALGLADNSIEVYEVSTPSGAGASAAHARVHVLCQAGHRSDIRALALSPDSLLLLSCSHNSLKVWNPMTGVCLRSMDSGYGLSTLFIPNTLVGTKGGALEVYDVAAAQQLSVLSDAHAGAVWSLAPTPDGSGFASASADQSVKFWQYELQAASGTSEGGKGVGVANVRTLQMTDDVLCIRYSPDGKYIAVALLDSTIKVFFADTLKFFVSLYGHKLPVLCMDISADGALLVSGSADKNVKLWGLDFGDCHKSLFAHADSVMQVQFVANTHYFFSAGKDKLLKYWDGDKFEHLLTLEGHHAELWAMCISPGGEYVFTGSHDRSIRRWERTDEAFFVEEERESRLEALFEAPMEDSAGDGGGEAAARAGAAGRRTVEAVSAADSILEALDLAEQQQQQDTAADAATRLRGMEPSEYVLSAICSVRSSDLEQALLTLPFADALKLLQHAHAWLHQGIRVESAVRTGVLLLRIHAAQLVATPAARTTLVALHAVLRRSMQGQKDAMGYNLAAMAHLQRLLTVRSQAPFADVSRKIMDVRTKLAKGRESIVAEKRREKVRKKRGQYKKEGL